MNMNPHAPDFAPPVTGHEPPSRYLRGRLSTFPQPRSAPQMPGGDNLREAVVRQEVTRFRLCLLVLDDAAGLFRALAELTDLGLEPQQISLIGSQETLDALQVPGDLPFAMQNKLDQILKHKSLPLQIDGACRLAVRGSQPLSELLRTSGSGDAFDWMQDHRRKEFCRHAAGGAVVLLVSTATANQLSSSATALLRHGQHNLQTYVFARPTAT